VGSGASADDAEPNVLYIIANLPGPESPVSWFYNQESTAMNSYQLASIPKFDKEHKAIGRVAKSREWQNLIAEFDKLPTSERSNRKSLDAKISQTRISNEREESSLK
jgi:hypothetical protein